MELYLHCQYRSGHWSSCTSLFSDHKRMIPGTTFCLSSDCPALKGIYSSGQKYARSDIDLLCNGISENKRCINYVQKIRNLALLPRSRLSQRGRGTYLIYLSSQGDGCSSVYHFALHNMTRKQRVMSSKQKRILQPTKQSIRSPIRGCAPGCAQMVER